MPEIVVDSFAANEYVSTCIGFAQGLTRDHYYWDCYDNGFLGWGAGYDHDGAADGNYQSSREELTQGPGAELDVPNNTPIGWYTNKVLYRSASWLGGFDNALTGTFKIYVFDDNGDRRAYIYNSNYTPAGTPSAQHQFS